MLYISTRTDFDAEFFQFLDFFRDNARTRTVLREDVARNTVAAFLTDGIRVVFDTEFIDRPFVVRKGIVGNELHLFRIVEVEAGNEHVVSQKFGRIFNAVFLLLRAAGCSQNAAVNDGVAAYRCHLFKNNYRSTSLLGFNSCSKACKTRTNNDDISRFIPFCGKLDGTSSMSGFSAEKRNGAGRDRTTEERTAIKFNHFLLLQEHVFSLRNMLSN